MPDRGTARCGWRGSEFEPIRGSASSQLPRVSPGAGTMILPRIGVVSAWKRQPRSSAGTVGEVRTLAEDGNLRPLSVDYVVVAYRSEQHLGACLDAIDADRPKGASVVVVDNASPDESGDVARRHPSHPRLLVSPRNLGFGGACNLAVEDSNADLLFFVNPDARPAPGTTAGLIAVLEADPRVAAVGPRIQNRAGDLRAASAGFEPSLRSVLGHFLLLARLPWVGRLVRPLQLPSGSRAQLVDWVGGAALMVRTDAFREVDGFDASMFLYMEDVDLCRRLRALGLSIKYEPGVAVEHDVGGSQGTEQAERWFRAFHCYLARQRGASYARFASGLVAAGLGVRALLLIFHRPAHSRRLARAAKTAASLAVGMSRPHEQPAEL